jgi:NitT/TauT family transport system ATP-binding protein
VQRLGVDLVRLVLPDDPDPAPQIAGALAEVELEGAVDVYASRLSLGMARRAALARAFVVRPSLLLLDEPFVSLDEPTAHRLRLLLLELLERHGATALFVTHSLNEAIMLADRLLFLTASPGQLLDVRDVPLGRAERRQPARVEAFRQRLVDGDRRLAELLVPALETMP